MFNQTFLTSYILEAPLALAVERSAECTLFAQQHFKEPILDLGCGDGTFAKVLFSQQIDAGVDINPMELRKAHESGQYRELLCTSAATIDKPDKSYQTIMSNSVLEHIPDLDGVLLEARRLLKDEGRLLVTIPTDRFETYTLIHQILIACHLHQLAKQYRLRFNRFWKHYHCYSIAQWRAIFQRCGLEVVAYQEYNSKKHCLINDALVPLSIGSCIIKRLANRWFLFPGWRRVYGRLLGIMIKPLIPRTYIIDKDGGLVFMELKKHNF